MSTDARGAHPAKQQARREPIEFPKYVTVDGKPELALNAEHEADILNRACVVERGMGRPSSLGASRTQAPKGAEGGQIPAPIEPQDVAKALGIAWQGDKTLEKIKPEWKGVGKLPTPSSEKGVGGGDRALAREGESPADRAQLRRTPVERIGAPAIAADAKPQVLIPFDREEAVTSSEAARIAGCTAVTVRTWAAIHDLGRLIGHRWMVSRVALAMHLDGGRDPETAAPDARPYHAIRLRKTDAQKTGARRQQNETGQR